jgi:hypothetical protein
MRRNYISPEYENKFVNGSLSMSEQSNFFGSKMLNIEDNIDITNDDIIWYQRPNNEQLDFSIEKSIRSYFYSSIDSKRDNHRLIIDERQTEFQKLRNTRWLLEIDSNHILEDYIFASMKKYRTFEGLRNGMTVYNDVDLALRNYINRNVLNRYEFSKLELFIEYKELSTNNILKYGNVWNANIPMGSKLERFNLTQTITNNITASFEQQSSSQFAFEYYFNIYFTKI